MLDDRQLTSKMFASNNISMILCLISTIEFVAKDLERLKHSIGLSCWYGHSFSSKSTFPLARKRTSGPAQSNQAELDGLHDVERRRGESLPYGFCLNIFLFTSDVYLCSHRQSNRHQIFPWPNEGRRHKHKKFAWPRENNALLRMAAAMHFESLENGAMSQKAGETVTKMRQGFLPMHPLACASHDKFSPQPIVGRHRMHPHLTKVPLGAWRVAATVRQKQPERWQRRRRK